MSIDENYIKQTFFFHFNYGPSLGNQGRRIRKQQNDSLNFLLVKHVLYMDF